MPRYDKTGPRGLGPSTGRGLGPCGMGLCCGRGMFHCGPFSPWGYPVNEKDWKESLKDYKKRLQEELADVEEELKEG